MEVYAGFLEHTDHNLGRLFAVLKDLEILQDTLIYVMIGDNGASAEGSLQGTFNEMVTLMGFAHLEQYVVEGKDVIPEGTHQVRIEFKYDGGGPAKGGDVTLYVDGKEVGKGRVKQTEPGVFSADETCDIRTESASPVTSDYSTRKFTGVANWVEIDADKAAIDKDHLIARDERLSLAMAFQ